MVNSLVVPALAAASTFNSVSKDTVPDPAVAAAKDEAGVGPRQGARERRPNKRVMGEEWA